MLESFARIYPGAAENSRALPNPTDFKRLEKLAAEPPPREFSAGRLTLISVGRLTPQKRFDVLLQALARVRRDFDVRLWICGEGPLRRRIARWITELGLEDGVEMPGFCDNPFALIRQADLFVMTSDFEGLPNALIEAQGLGLPAVATDCPYGPAEIIEDGVTGRLVPMADATAVARAIIEILGDSERRRRMGEEAARRARRRVDVARGMPRWQKLLAEAAETLPAP
jgi:glycosyltransferase involved in cell wall biosynthesis